jgi:Dolichyl-phosphate-mannose-protein mannosyltransferase
MLVVTLAAAATMLNALKPPVIDDSAYLYYGREFAQHPSHPYDFDYYGKPANTFLVPPVLPAWLAAGGRLLGDDFVVLKLWLFPIMVLFTASMLSLLRRFAPGREAPFLILTVFSPAILPSINLMLDVPVLALGLAATALFLRAVDERSLPMSLAAGLVAAMAMETKYTAFTLPAVFLAFGWLHGQTRISIAASLTAVAAFAGCEAAIAHVQGDSHFLLAMQSRGAQKIDHFRLLNAAITQFGGLCGPLWLIGLLAFGVSRRVVIVLLGGMSLGFGLLLLLSESSSVLLSNSHGPRPLLTLNHLVFVPIGAGFLVTLNQMMRRTWMAAAPGDPERRLDRFLVLWVTIELVGYLMISPFPAVRRILGLLMATTILFARRTSFSRLSRQQLSLMNALTAAGVVLGLAYYAIDRRDALAEQDAFRQACTVIRERDPAAGIRVCGDWGIRYYFEKEGLRWSRNVGGDVEPGEWFIYDNRCAPPIDPEVAEQLELVGQVLVSGWPRVSTQKTFYMKNAPLIQSDEPLLELFVYRSRGAEDLHWFFDD